MFGLCAPDRSCPPPRPKDTVGCSLRRSSQAASGGAGDAPRPCLAPPRPDTLTMTRGAAKREPLSRAMEPQKALCSALAFQPLTIIQQPLIVLRVWIERGGAGYLNRRL